MATTAIDTPRYARRLKEAGVPTEQAEAMADAIGAELVERLPTKAAVETVQVALEGKILLVQWMLGFLLAGVVTLLWKVFS